MGNEYYIANTPVLIKKQYNENPLDNNII